MLSHEQCNVVNRPQGLLRRTGALRGGSSRVHLYQRLLTPPKLLKMVAASSLSSLALRASSGVSAASGV